MSFSQLKNMFGSLLAAATLVGLTLIMASPASAQRKGISFTEEIIQSPLALKATISQCANGPFSDPTSCFTSTGDTGWISGNVNQGKGHYNEGDFLPYRIEMTDLSVGGDYTIVIGFDRQDGSQNKYAIDYVGTYNYSEPNAYPCGDQTGNIHCPTGYSTFPAPVDPLNTADGVAQVAGVFTLWGGTINYADYVACPGTTLADQTKRCIAVRFTATDVTAVLAWGGHLSTQADWGVGNTLVSIPGSSYHSRVIGFGVTPGDFPTTYPTTGGNQDIQLQASNINPGTVITIFKRVSNQTGSSNQDFAFTSNSTELGLSFSLKDNRLGDATGAGQSSSTYTTAKTVTVTELAVAGWTLQDISCSAPVGTPITYNLGARSVSITVDPTVVASISCVFQNGELGVTAAPANITGRVATDVGYGIRGAVMTLTDLSTGQVRYAVTNNFGYYNFTDAMTDDVYVLSVASKRYTFATNSITFTLRDNLSGMDFIASTSGTSILPTAGAKTTILKAEAPARKVESPAVVNRTIINFKKDKMVDEDQ